VDDPGFEFCQGQENVSLFHNAQTGSGGLRANYSIATWSFTSGGKTFCASDSPFI